jgi:hypothetical protein
VPAHANKEKTFEDGLMDKEISEGVPRKQEVKRERRRFFPGSPGGGGNFFPSEV